MVWEKKPDFRAEFEPNQVNMFRVIMEQNFVGSLEEHQQTMNMADLNLAELYSLQLEKLRISRMSHLSMSTRQIYLI